jgi:hypothetical protein
LFGIGSTSEGTLQSRSEHMVCVLDVARTKAVANIEAKILRHCKKTTSIDGSSLLQYSTVIHGCAVERAESIAHVSVNVRANRVALSPALSAESGEPSSSHSR